MFDSLAVFPLETPALRPVELIPVSLEGGTGLLVRDPLGVLPGAVLSVNPLLLLFLEMADGQTTLPEMADRVSRMAGQTVPVQLVESLVQQLDEALLLQSERFRGELLSRVESFRQAPTRAASVYRSDTPDRLAIIKELGEEFRRHGSGDQAPPPRLDLPARSVRGLLAPHIDYHRGGPAYAWAYRALREHGVGARTWIVLGTCHRPTSHRFIATRKHFETPLGLVETDLEVLAALEHAFGGELYRDEYAHAAEHTIELQALYLQHIFSDDGRIPKIVPILVGSFHDVLERGQTPGQVPEIRKFCDAIRAVLEQFGDRVGIIGGVDLAHCGPHFDEQEPLNDPERILEIETADRAMLEALESGDPDRFFGTFRPDLNARNVCSIAPIYCVMDAFRGQARPKVLTYSHHNSDDRTCLVSFTSVAFVQ